MSATSMSSSSFLQGLPRGGEGAGESRDSHRRERIISVDESESEEDASRFSSESEGQGEGEGGKMRRKAGALATKCLSERELQDLRLKINSRERRRMHDLNNALDGLREVMPYAHGPSVRKLSKIATLLLARNYILMLSSSLEEMKKLVSDIYQNPHHHSRPLPAPTLHAHAHAHAHVQAGGALPLLPHMAGLTPSALAALSPHEIASVTSTAGKDHSPTPTSVAASPGGLGHERHVLYGRYPVPCTCTQCTLEAPRAFHSMVGKYPSPYPSPHTFRK